MCEDRHVSISAFVEKLGASAVALGHWIWAVGRAINYSTRAKAQSGFKRSMLYEPREGLDHIRKTSRLSITIKKPKATWAKLELYLSSAAGKRHDARPCGTLLHGAAHDASAHIQWDQSELRRSSASNPLC